MEAMIMQREEQEDTTIYKVVVNHEEQYSIWPADRDNPLGWKDVGKQGLKAECLAYIKEVWTDMRPLSLRKRMQESARQPE
jgi:MbtH protein